MYNALYNLHSFLVFQLLPVYGRVTDRSDNHAAEEAYNGCNIEWVSFGKQPSWTFKSFYLVKVRNIVEKLVISSGTYYNKTKCFRLRR